MYNNPVYRFTVYSIQYRAKNQKCFLSIAECLSVCEAGGSGREELNRFSLNKTHIKKKKKKKKKMEG